MKAIYLSIFLATLLGCRGVSFSGITKSSGDKASNSADESPADEPGEEPGDNPEGAEGSLSCHEKITLSSNSNFEHLKGTDKMCGMFFDRRTGPWMSLLISAGAVSWGNTDPDDSNWQVRLQFPFRREAGEYNIVQRLFEDKSLTWGNHPEDTVLFEYRLDIGSPSDKKTADVFLVKSGSVKVDEIKLPTNTKEPGSIKGKFKVTFKNDQVFESEFTTDVHLCCAPDEAIAGPKP